MWRWVRCSFLLPYRSLPIPSSKQTVICSSRNLVTYYGQGDHLSLWLLYWVTRYKHDQRRLVYFPTYPPSGCEYVSPLLYSRRVDVQMYSCVAGVYRGAHDRRTVRRLVFSFLSTPTSEADQKKEKKRLKPAMPIKPKIKKQKPEREGDKEKQEENEPRTEGAVFQVIQQGSVYEV